MTGFSMRRIKEAVASQLAAGSGPAAPTTRGVLERAEPPWPTPLGQGIRPSEGVRVLRRILDAGTESRILVTPRDLAIVRRDTEALTRIRLEAELTGSGARTRHDRPEVSSDFVAPEDNLERRIAAIWQSVLGLDRVGVNDNFFELGGSSLNGVQLVAELKAGLKVDLPAVAIFEAPTVSSLARYLRDQDSGEEKFTAARQRAERKRRALGRRRPGPPRRKT